MCTTKYVCEFLCIILFVIIGKNKFTIFVQNKLKFSKFQKKKFLFHLSQKTNEIIFENNPLWLSIKLNGNATREYWQYSTYCCVTKYVEKIKNLDGWTKKSLIRILICNQKLPGHVGKQLFSIIGFSSPGLAVKNRPLFRYSKVNQPFSSFIPANKKKSFEARPCPFIQIFSKN